MASTLVWESAAECTRAAGAAGRRFGIGTAARHTRPARRPAAASARPARSTTPFAPSMGTASAMPSALAAPRAARAASASTSRRRRRIVARARWATWAAMAGDVLMVALWAAMVPGLMWLGTAAGF